MEGITRLIRQFTVYFEGAWFGPFRDPEQSAELQIALIDLGLPFGLSVGLRILPFPRRFNAVGQLPFQRSGDAVSRGPISGVDVPAGRDPDFDD